MNLLKTMIASFLLALMAPAALAGSYSSTVGDEYKLNQASPGAMAETRLGTKVIRGVLQTATLRYDFAKAGGATGAISLVSELGKAWTLPKNAVIVGCIIDVVTAPTPTVSTTPTIAIGTGQAANDLKAATSYASFSGEVACIPTGSAASAIKLTADSLPTLTIATANILSGKINVVVQYIISD